MLPRHRVERRSSSASTCAPAARPPQLAEREGVDIRLYTIIYDAIDDVRDAMEGLLAPTLREKILGQGRGAAGLHDPERRRGRRLLRHRRQDPARRQGAPGARPRRGPRPARSATLRRFKDDAREVAAGYECGMSPRELPGRQGGRHRSRPTRWSRWPAGSRRRRDQGRAGGRAHAPDGRGAGSPWWSACSGSTLFLPENHSLKGKRSVLRKIKARVREQVQRLDRRVRRPRPVAARHAGREPGRHRRAARRRRRCAKSCASSTISQVAELGEERLEFLHY